MCCAHKTSFTHRFQNPLRRTNQSDWPCTFYKFIEDIIIYGQIPRRRHSYGQNSNKINLFLAAFHLNETLAGYTQAGAEGV